MPLRVIVDPDACIGSATCVHLAPGGFALDEDGVATPVDPPTATDDQLRLAERSCPTGAIFIDERLPGTRPDRED